MHRRANNITSICLQGTGLVKHIALQSRKKPLIRTIFSWGCHEEVYEAWVTNRSASLAGEGKVDKEGHGVALG